MVDNIEANLVSDTLRRHAETKETNVLSGQKQITPWHAQRRRPGSLFVDNGIVQWYLGMHDIP